MQSRLPRHVARKHKDRTDVNEILQLSRLKKDRAFESLLSGP